MGRGWPGQVVGLRGPPGQPGQGVTPSSTGGAYRETETGHGQTLPLSPATALQGLTARPAFQNWGWEGWAPNQCPEMDLYLIEGSRCLNASLEPCPFEVLGTTFPKPPGRLVSGEGLAACLGQATYQGTRQALPQCYLVPPWPLRRLFPFHRLETETREVCNARALPRPWALRSPPLGGAPARIWGPGRLCGVSRMQSGHHLML